MNETRWTDEGGESLAEFLSPVASSSDSLGPEDIVASSSLALIRMIGFDFLADRDSEDDDGDSRLLNGDGEDVINGRGLGSRGFP
jgi:hypothetical protein